MDRNHRLLPSGGHHPGTAASWLPGGLAWPTLGYDPGDLLLLVLIPAAYNYEALLIAMPVLHLL